MPATENKKRGTNETGPIAATGASILQSRVDDKGTEVGKTSVSLRQFEDVNRSPRRSGEMKIKMQELNDKEVKREGG
jgi:hypothetical protein